MVSGNRHGFEKEDLRNGRLLRNGEMKRSGNGGAPAAQSGEESRYVGFFLFFFFFLISSFSIIVSFVYLQSLLHRVL